MEDKPAATYLLSASRAGGSAERNKRLCPVFIDQREGKRLLLGGRAVEQTQR